MNTQTETISPVKVLLEQLARVTEWNGGSLPSIVLFGECQFPNNFSIVSQKDTFHTRHAYSIH